MKYLAIAQNIDTDMNVTFDALTFNDAVKVLQSLVKQGTMFQMFKLVELETLKSKKVYFGQKINRSKKK